MNASFAPIGHPQAWTWLDAPETITVDELCQASGLSAGQLQELVDYGALVPVTAAPPARPLAYLFSASCVQPLRRACALQRDFDLDLFTAGFLMGYLNRIDSLQQQVLSMDAQRPFQPSAS